MNFELNESQILLRDSIREFVAQEIVPHAAKWDQEQCFPAEVIAKCAEMGLMGMTAPKQYGGAEMSVVDYALVIEEIARGCASTAVILSVQNSLAIGSICNFGTETQKQKYLPALASGKKIGCFAITEPAAGSDAGSQRTICTDKGDHYLINGSKNFITNAPQSDICILFATHDTALGNKGISAFIVERSFPGFIVGKSEDKLGIRASSTASLTLDNLRVPKENLLGEAKSGFKVAMSCLDAGRIGIASQALGIAQAALDAAIGYAKQREQFGKKLASFQGLRWMLVDMSVAVEAARLLTWRAAMVKDSGKRCTFYAAQAKLFASETANHVANKSVQIHGGYGYIKEYPVERHMRDARVTEIYEGTSQIQRLVIAASMLKEPALVTEI
jgi:butyryl-CoA dehydrogenase